MLLDTNEMLRPLISLTELLEVALGFSCFSAEVWCKYNVEQKYAAYLHVVIGALPVYVNLVEQLTREDLLFFCVLLNVVLIFSFGIVHANIYMILVSYCIFIEFILNTFVLNVFVEELKYVLSALYSYCALKAIIIPV